MRPPTRSAATASSRSTAARPTPTTPLRNTEGFGTREADILVTNRTTSGGAEVSAFLVFLDGIAGQGSAERMLGSINEAMRQNEGRYSTDPWRFTGLGDNPRR